MTKIQKLQARITQAVARARALGAELVAQGSWGAEYDRTAGWIVEPNRFDGKKEVCICGAIAFAENLPNGKGLLRAISKKYGITVAQAASLSDGFEGYKFAVGDRDGDEYPTHYALDKTWYRIGRKWRARADRVED